MLREKSAARGPSVWPGFQISTNLIVSNAPKQPDRGQQAFTGEPMTNPCWVFFASCFLFRVAVLCFVGCERFVSNRSIYLVCPARAALLSAQALHMKASSLPHWETDSSLSARHWNDPRWLRNTRVVIKCPTRWLCQGLLWSELSLSDNIDIIKMEDINICGQRGQARLTITL